MISRNAPVRRLALAASAAALAAVLAAGCAAPIRIDESVDALALVGPGATVYARMDAARARELVPSLVPADQAAALDPLLERTRCLALGLGAAPAAGTDPSARAASGRGSGRFDAAFLGDFPFRTASLALAADRSWKREGRGFSNELAGIHAAFPGPELVLASTERLEKLLELAKAPGPSPIPSRLALFASSEIAIWAPEPFSKLIASIIGEEMDIPAVGLLISASPIGLSLSASGSESPSYEATVAFLMSDADSARIFRPALRLAWYGIARGLFGDEADDALGIVFSLDGDLYWASGARFSSSALAAALVRIREGYLGG